MICVSHPGLEGPFSRNDPERRSQEWRPADAARTAPQGGPDPDRQALTAWRGQSLYFPCFTAGRAAWVRGWKAPRWSAERSPGRTGKVRALQARASRLARATEVQECACRRSITPHRGDGIAAVATAAGAKALVGSTADAKRKAHAKRRTTRAQQRAAGTNKTALFDIVNTGTVNGSLSEPRPRTPPRPVRAIAISRRRTRMCGSSRIGTTSAVRPRRSSSRAGLRWPRRCPRRRGHGSRA